MVSGRRATHALCSRALHTMQQHAKYSTPIFLLERAVAYLLIVLCLWSMTSLCLAKARSTKKSNDFH